MLTRKLTGDVRDKALQVEKNNTNMIDDRSDFQIDAQEVYRDYIEAMANKEKRSESFYDFNASEDSSNAASNL